MNDDREETTPSDARAALASVMAAKSAIRQRSVWPFWLSIFVAVSFGTYAMLRTYIGVDRPLIVELTIVLSALPAFLLWCWFDRSRGIVVRDTLRWASAVLVTATFVLDAHIDNYVGSFQAALVLGALNSMTILLFWGIADGLSHLKGFIRLRAHAGS